MLSRRAALCARPLASVARARLYSNTLDVKIPDISKDPHALEPQAKVPFVFDLWDSKEKRTADAAAAHAHPVAVAESLSLPKVITAAAADTHLGGGPSSNTYEPALEQAHPVIQKAADATGLFSDIGIPSRAQIYQSLAKITDPASAPPLPKSRPLTEEDRKGLWILLGLVAGGWIAGGIFSPRKRKQHH